MPNRYTIHRSPRFIHFFPTADELKLEFPRFRQKKKEEEKHINGCYSILIQSKIALHFSQKQLSSVLFLFTGINFACFA